MHPNFHLSYDILDRKYKNVTLIDWCLTSREQFFSYIQDEKEKS